MIITSKVVVMDITVLMLSTTLAGHDDREIFSYLTDYEASFVILVMRFGGTEILNSLLLIVVSCLNVDQQQDRCSCNVYSKKNGWVP